MDLRQQLQQHLGSAYTLERELGGGGMSRVFVADEVRLGRRVVVKVLSPDLAQGLNAERFEREIRLAASLQQANIVPLLVAGEVGGIPYFTMPFVEGESLRARLQQGPLPITEVASVLRDVTRALAYAHARGVVHRDIKPDNVLLSGGAAVVTDFGIAKAISASRTEGAGATLTQLGTSLGTPAYMAPEQVAGDPNLDARVDLYALGCMAFELLTGQQPFANRTPQKMLAAHLSEAAPSATALRPDAPPALGALVTRLMAKDPADRPQTASDVLRELDAAVTTSAPNLAFSAPGMFRKALLYYAVATAVVLLCARAAIIAIGLPDWVFPGAIIVMALGLPVLFVTAYVQRVARHVATATPTLTPGGTMAPRGASGTIATMAIKASPHLTWRRARRGGVYAVGGFAGLVVVFMVTRALGIGPWGSLLAAGKLGANDRIVLADFVTPPADSSLEPIVAEAVRAALSQSSSVHLVPQTDIADALQQMERSKDTPLADPGVVREVAQRTNARAVLNGRIAPLGNGFAVSLQLSGVDGGAMLASYQATAAGPQDLLKVVDELTRKLRGRVGESLKHVQQSIPLERATTTSLEALRKYSDAVVANDIDFDYDRAVRSAREAVALDSTFALAWRKLAVALFNDLASTAAQDSAVEKAARYADRLPDREKYLALGYYYETSLANADRGKSIAAYQSAYAADSSNTTSTNQLGLMFVSRHQADSALRYLHREVAIEPDPSTAARIPWALAIFGDTAAAAAALDSLRHATGDRDSTLMMDGARGAVYVARGQYDSLLHLTDAMSRSSNRSIRSTGLLITRMAYSTGGRLTKATAVDNAVRSEQAAQHLAPMFPVWPATFDIVFRGHNADGIRLLDSMTQSVGWSTASPSDRPYLPVVELYARAGDVTRAEALLNQALAEDPSTKSPDGRPDVARARGEIALARGNTAEALQQFRAGAVGPDGAPVDCRACVDFAMARAFDQAREPDSATAYLERYLAVPAVERGFNAEFTVDWRDLAAVQKRLGELYDAKHDRQKAMEHYTAFVDLWKNADPDLQPTVTSVKKRLAELAAQEGP